MTAVRINTATNRFRKSVVELHCRQNHRRKDRAEEHAGLRRLDRAIHGIEDAVAEHAVTVQVVSNRYIKHLIEIPKLPVRPSENTQSDSKQRYDNDAELNRSSS